MRGEDTSSAVQIDHVVALSDSWQKGAQQWDAAKREAFANDPLNLLAVDGPLNQQKGDGDAATWLPAEQGVPVRVRRAAGGREVHLRALGHAGGAGRDGRACCRRARRAAARRVGGPARSRPSRSPGGRRARGPGACAGAPRHPPSAAPPAAVAGPFKNCTEAWAAGAAPVHVGDPGYAPKLDRDNDGIGCESARDQRAGAYDPLA